MGAMKEIRVRRNDLASAEIVTRDLPELEDNEALIEVEEFGLTANNVTYGVVGEQIGYWKFFPTGSDDTGIIPVWGFGRVVATRSDQVSEGERLYGYFPMGSHMKIRPLRKPSGVIETAEHRASLPPAYNRYRVASEEPEEAQKREEARSVLFPLFATSFIIADWLQDNDYFGAEQIVVTSASSKTGFGAGFALKRLPGAPNTVGLTSPSNVGFVKDLGAFDDVRPYDHASALPQMPTALVDMSGNAEVITAIHKRMGEDLKSSAIVGATHWQAPRQKEPLPGAKPTMFFAPAQIQKRDAELGPGVLMQQALDAWIEITDKLGDDFSYEHHNGAEAALDIWVRTVKGEVSPKTGILASLTKA